MQLERLVAVTKDIPDDKLIEIIYAYKEGRLFVIPENECAREEAEDAKK